MSMINNVQLLLVSRSVTKLSLLLLQQLLTGCHSNGDDDVKSSSRSNWM